MKDFVLKLLMDLLDGIVVDQFDLVFYYIESRRDRFTRDLVANRGKGPGILRLCNEMLKRLSKAEHTRMCGRVLMFMTSVFSLSERSGMPLSFFLS